MIIDLYDPEEGEIVCRLDIDVIQEHEVSQQIEAYKNFDQEAWTVTAFLAWLNGQGIKATRVETEEYPLFYF